jgi:molybdenum-dependent DNA-binding transcriptional regulator ModE
MSKIEDALKRPVLVAEALTYVENWANGGLSVLTPHGYKTIEDYIAQKEKLAQHTEKLAEALDEVLKQTESWNAAVEKIVGRQPNTGIGLEPVKATLAAYRALKAEIDGGK